MFSTASVTVYWIASRSSELVNNLFEGGYTGWFMSDGYHVDGNFPNRLRCCAHLVRKARGLQESFGLNQPDDSELKPSNCSAIS